MYDSLVKLLDSIPTFPFIGIICILFLFIQKSAFKLLATNSTYRALCYEKQSAVPCHVMTVLVQLFISYMALVTLWRKDIDLLDTSKPKISPQVITNIATIYTLKDVAELFFNRKIARTTIVHHICVIMAYLFVLKGVTTDFNVEGFFKCFVGYAAFTSFTFPYQIYLSLRFFLNRTGIFNTIFKTFAFFSRILCVSVNFSWQTFYFIKLITIFYFTGSSAIRLLISGVLYTLCMSAWVREEWVIISHLRRKEARYLKT